MIASMTSYMNIYSFPLFLVWLLPLHDFLPLEELAGSAGRIGRRQS